MVDADEFCCFCSCCITVPCCYWFLAHFFTSCPRLVCTVFFVQSIRSSGVNVSKEQAFARTARCTPGRVTYTCWQYYYIGFDYEEKTVPIWRRIADILKILVIIAGIFREQKCTLLPGPSGKMIPVVNLQFSCILRRKKITTVRCPGYAIFQDYRTELCLKKPPPVTTGR